LGLSRTSVSEALRNLPRVNERTRARVQEAAAAAGYRVNPLASSVLGELRRDRAGAFHGVLAVISLEEPTRPQFPGPYWRDLLRGATARAQELGFGLERFMVGEKGVSIHRLDTILQSRGIRGVLIMPAWNRPDFSHLNWNRYAGVYADYLIDAPALHSICPDHPRAMMTVMRKLHELGYRRPGLVLQAQESARLQHRWLGAYLSSVHLDSSFTSPPPLVPTTVSEGEFSEWFTRYKPDVVIGHRAELAVWMRKLGADVPRTHGFCCLNVSINSTPCAGINQQPYYVGFRGIESVVSQLIRNEFGIPERPYNLAIPSCWVNGPTLPEAPKKQASIVLGTDA
jgi:LacI family transcriptional regulator